MLTSIVSMVASLWCLMQVIKHTPPKPLELVHEVLPEIIFVNPQGDAYHTSQCSSVTLRASSYTLCKNCKMGHHKKRE